MNNINILTFGADASASNMGCMALGRTFIAMCEEIAIKNKLKIKISMLSEMNFVYASKWITVDTVIGHFRSLNFYKKLNSLIKNSNLVVDFTLGDSFTDIYGLSRFVTGTIPKYMTVFQKKKIIMGPQTIGPFNNAIVRHLAKRVLRKIDRVYCRDKKSLFYAKHVLNKRCLLTTDIAFSLPADLDFLNNIEFSSRKKIGINVSALLWFLGYYKSDHIKLKLDYQEYIIKLIEFCNDKNFEIHLISHVIYNQGGKSDDYTAALQVKRKFTNVILAPRFENPMQAKAYISKMNCFIGARMHATIGAISMNVPTIPVAYSRKFTGLYKDLGYHNVIDATTADTDTALRDTFRKIIELDCLKQQVINTSKRAKRMNDAFKMELEAIVKGE